MTGDDEFEGQTAKPASRKSRRPQLLNTLQVGISNFLVTGVVNHSNLVLDHNLLPKRYTVYPPLLLLPANFSTYSLAWQSLFSGLDKSDQTSLFTSICAAFKGQGISHVAINAPISTEDTTNGDRNVMRSPAGLVPVHGNFGPLQLSSGSQPVSADFDQAFWASVVQNGGIVQVWAPLWTMFSRGNVSEKARILGQQGNFQGLTEEELGYRLSDTDVIDFYIGIGYFAFSYLKRGARRVWGWEINGWSVEGLRRGAKKNGWEVSIVRVDEDGHASRPEIIELLREISRDDSASRCVVFHGDNRWAAQIMGMIEKSLEALGTSLNTRHANLGLLPTSKGSWQDATRCLDAQRGGWLHVHENVDVKEIEMARQEVVEQIKGIVRAQRGESWAVFCCHTEQVKTFAPGVMHCVFDIQIFAAS